MVSSLKSALILTVALHEPGTSKVLLGPWLNNAEVYLILFIKTQNTTIAGQTILDLIWFIVFNDIFSNISAKLWRLVLVVEEVGAPGENHRPWQTMLVVRSYLTNSYNRTYCKKSNKIYTNNISTKNICVIISTEYNRNIFSLISEKYSSLNQNRNINIYFGRDVNDMFTQEGAQAVNKGNTKSIKAIGNENCLVFSLET